MRRFVSIAITTFSYLFADNLCSVSDSMYGVIHVTRQQLRPMLLHQWVKNLPAHKVFHYQFELIVDEVRQSEDRIFYCTKFKWFFFLRIIDWKTFSRGLFPKNRFFINRRFWEWNIFAHSQYTVSFIFDLVALLYSLTHAQLFPLPSQMVMTSLKQTTSSIAVLGSSYDRLVYRPNLF